MVKKRDVMFYNGEVLGVYHLYHNNTCERW